MWNNKSDIVLNVPSTKIISLLLSKEEIYYLKFNILDSYLESSIYNIENFFWPYFSSKINKIYYIGWSTYNK